MKFSRPCRTMTFGRMCEVQWTTNRAHAYIYVMCLHDCANNVCAYHDMFITTCRRGCLMSYITFARTSTSSFLVSGLLSQIYICTMGHHEHHNAALNNGLHNPALRLDCWPKWMFVLNADGLILTCRRPCQTHPREV